MIVVVEGPTEAGKTTWCRTHFRDAHVTEADGGREDWAAVSMRRWAAAVDLERRRGTAVCDSDPFKLHYAWGMWRTGQLPADRWRAERAAARDAFAAGALGLADLVLVSIPDEATLRSRRDGDPHRRRHNFERHVVLAEPLREWYAAVDAADPGRVQWALPEHGMSDVPEPRADRCLVALFDAVVSALPQR